MRTPHLKKKKKSKGERFSVVIKPEQCSLAFVNKGGAARPAESSQPSMRQMVIDFRRVLKASC